MSRRAPVILLALALLLALPSFASESFQLTIPTRGNPQQETGEVRVTMTLSAAAAGSQLVVNGSTTLNLGNTVMVNGDSVTYAATTGNDVRITYRPLSNFSGDFCQGFAAIQKDVPMRFVGAQDVLSYRMTTYIVASPMVECSQATKHTGDTPAFLTPVDDGVAPALVADFLGRNTFDVVLVLDKSGSMADLPPGANTGSTKAEILKAAVDAFIGTWRQTDAPITPPEWSGDRIGLEFFNNAPLPQTFPSGDPPANFFVKRGSVMPGNWNDVINGVNTLSPGGSTSIGGGINDGMAKWAADPKSDLSLILVTDGKQNTSPLITAQPSGFLGLTPVAGFPTELRKRFVPIHTIAFGTPGGVDLDLLTNVSFETSGQSFLTVNDSTMFDVFSATLVAILKGNTAGMSLEQHGTLIGSGPSALYPTLVDPSARRAVFLLQWGPERRFALDMDVYRPGVDPNAGGLPAVANATEKQPAAVIKRFDMKSSDVGTWNVRVKRADSSPTDNVPYTVHAIFLEKHLDYRVAFNNVHTKTGDKVGIEAVVAWDGKPLPGLPAGSIRVVVQRPPQALGTVLRNSKVDPGTGNTVTPTGDILTPYDRKLAGTIDARNLSTIYPRDYMTITLTDAGRGVYTGTFGGTTISGEYNFQVLLDWDDPRTGKLHRQEVLSQNIRIQPDAASSTMTTTVDANGNYLINVTPADRFGNYMGPGWASLVKAVLKSTGTLSRGNPTDVAQNGTYTFTVSNVPAGEVPIVDITVDGVPFGTAPKP